jgi:prepilin-type N-terminal cleavage/methylation domain-containing protein
VDNYFRKQHGFTLIEILIVVILLGILATIIVPQLSMSSDDAKLNTLKTNLNYLRNTIDLYYHQHNNTYPGVNDSNGILSTKENDSVKGFEDQLFLYTDLKGEAVTIKDGTHQLGPYIKGGELPRNPFNNKKGVVCDITTTDITARVSDGNSGWKFYTKTGILMANDGAHDDL